MMEQAVLQGGLKTSNHLLVMLPSSKCLLVSQNSSSRLLLDQYLLLKGQQQNKKPAAATAATHVLQRSRKQISNKLHHEEQHHAAGRRMMRTSQMRRTETKSSSSSSSSTSSCRRFLSTPLQAFHSTTQSATTCTTILNLGREVVEDHQQQQQQQQHLLQQLPQSLPAEQLQVQDYIVLKTSLILSKKEFFELPHVPGGTPEQLFDCEDEFLGNKVSLQLVSEDVDPTTGIGKLSHEMEIENWMESPSPSDTTSDSSTGGGTYESRFDLEFKVKKEFGVPGAFIIRNHHRDEFFLKSVTIEVKAAQGDEESDHNSTVHFICDSCIYNTKAYKSDRIFFSNKVYLPSDTPEGMVVLRELELINMRGDGTGERKEADRIYDYALYNDLGDSDCHESMKRPVLGGSQELPYPRRLRTGRPPSTTDPENQESRVDSVFLNLYIPRDERHTQVRVKGVVSKEDAILAAGRKLLPALQSLYSTHQEFTSLNNVRDLYKAPDIIAAPASSSSSSLSSSSTETRSSEPDEDPENQPEGMTYPVPKIIAVDEKAWTLDVEFGREWLAGMNPAVIQCLQEFPMISQLDPAVYGNPVSTITVDHIEPFLDGLTVEKAIAEKKLFFVDYHDGFLPYLNKINSTPTSHAYASRTVLFLTSDGTLRPVAIELTLPPPYPGAENIARVFTPPSQGKNWVWEIAKAHVLANDTGYHQLVSHWLRTHATIEPIVIATHRQLSPLHPLHQALVPHLKGTLDINAAARKALINAGGIIEKTFTPHQYAMQISSGAYKNDWRFDEQALPADLIKRGMAIPDVNSKHGLKLIIEDYPYAMDGLELWAAITAWLHDHIEIFYADDQSVQTDTELQNWWTEIREVGHGDKKDAEGWPVLNSKPALVHTLSIIVWLSSCQHAAVNFGQYDHSAFMPSHPTSTRRQIPEEGTPEYEELERDPESFYLSTISTATQASVIMTTTEALSTHGCNELFLGQRSSPLWTSDPKVLAVFTKFQEHIAEIEELIKSRNMDRTLKNRYGPVEFPYEFLYPSSVSGLTAKGVPNSTSI